MVSDKKNIDKLLERYFEGQTTLQEEALLNEYFRSDSVASHHEQYRALFQYFSNERTQSNALQPRLKSNRTKRFWFSGIAAGLLLFVSFFGWQSYQRQQLAQQAYQDSYKALAIIGKHFDQGQNAIQELAYLEKSRTLVFRAQTNK
ncbi:MAG: hypothetical protein CR968_04180 [Flavobacteriia bacterium]|nr:MAG: hypothetical protein CR968_04180 [Flavobacteriia bacterium]